VDLVSSSPAAEEVLAAPPSQVRVLFSGRVEPRFSELRLVAPHGAEVPLGEVAFAPGSDREFFAPVPPLNVPGGYTVRWRTAGADGHVLTGSFTFHLPAEALPPGTLAAPEPVAHHDPGHASDRAHHAGQGDPDAPAHDHVMVEVGAPPVLPVLARWLHFLGLTLLIGAVAFRVLLLPRLPHGEAAVATMRRRAWRTAPVAALILAGTALFRLWLQSVAFHGAADAWDAGLVWLMLRETAWGRAWLLQLPALLVLGQALLLARGGHERTALPPAVLATVALSMVPALSGHAAGAAAYPVLAVINDTLHVLAAGAWLGTLALVLVAALPALTRREGTADGDVATLIHRFSPLALACAGLVLLTGVVNSAMHLGAPAQLVETDYGRALLAKVGVVGLLGVTGFYNWRVVRPRLGTPTATGRLRVSVAVELALAVAVLGLTALLTGLHRP
jgi:putative copper export protein/methionine-rich copper-binding protein CopC